MKTQATLVTAPTVSHNSLARARQHARWRWGARMLLSVALTVVALTGAAAKEDEKAMPKKEHLQAALAEKMSRTPAQQKIDSQLLFAIRADRGEQPVKGVPGLHGGMRKETDGRVKVEISGEVTPRLIAALRHHPATLLDSFPAMRAAVALVDLQQVERIAELDEVQFIRVLREPESNVRIPIISEGDWTHGTRDTQAGSGARTRFGVRGAGVKVGVMSNGVKSLNISKTTGELPNNVVVLSGQAGPADKDEGTAMMEIVHDLAPEAELVYATGSTGSARMAQNIRDLRAAGCSIIVDDITYSIESPFQDGVIAQAVNEVSAAGVLYFSSAANSGNLTSGTSCTWEGNFADGGVMPFGRVHSFGSQNFNTNPEGKIPAVDLYWSDPLGASSNDYDIFITDDAGYVLDMSTNIQSGTQDPYEFVDEGNKTAGTGRRGSRIFIVQKPNAQSRFLHLRTGRDRLQIQTTGSTRGHNASGAANAFSVAAAPANMSFGLAPNSPGPFPGRFTTASKFERFSSDGPRRIFYEANGTAITPGNFGATGGRLLNKPDFTAADGVQTSVPHFQPFYGTSAAAPHAAAIAALIKSKFPAATPAQIRTALVSTALDIAPAGFDPNTGAGIIMAIPALTALAPPPATFGFVGGAPDFLPENANVTVTKPPPGFGRFANVFIHCANNTSQVLSVRVFTQDGTARSGPGFNEYQPVDVTLNFAPGGESNQQVSISIPNSPDNFQPGNGTFTVNLANPSAGTIIKAQATVTLAEGAAPAANLTVGDHSLVEGNPGVPVPGGTAFAQFLVTLSPASDRNVTVNAATADGTAVGGRDFEPTQLTLTFRPGETQKFVAVPVYNDASRNEAAETFFLNLSGQANSTIADGQAVTTIMQPAIPGPAVNISTRMRVLTGDNVLIGGFILTGNEPKKVIIRGIGPSLGGANVADPLADPVLTLKGGGGEVIAENDDWRTNQADVQASGIPPSNDLESAIVTTLNPGAYTAILAGKNDGQGVGLVEVYDLALQSDSELANISTRGFIDTGDNVMIGGFIIGTPAATGQTRLIARAIGPSLPVDGRLEDPVLELYNASGTLLSRNDNWKETQENDIRGTHVPPQNDFESAIVTTLAPGAYTAIVRGKNNSAGIGLVEVYKLN